MAYIEVVEVDVWVDHLWVGGLRVASWLFSHTLWPRGVASWQLVDWAEQSDIPVSVSDFSRVWN